MILDSISICQRSTCPARFESIDHPCIIRLQAITRLTNQQPYHLRSQSIINHASFPPFLPRISQNITSILHLPSPFKGHHPPPALCRGEARRSCASRRCRSWRAWRGGGSCWRCRRRWPRWSAPRRAASPPRRAAGASPWKDGETFRGNISGESHLLVPQCPQFVS